MDDVQVGSIIRAVRIRRGMSQAQVATEAGLSRALVSQIERGGLEDTSVRNIRRVAGAVGVSLPFDPSWRGAELASLLDERHALLVRDVVKRLTAVGWQTIPEHTFNVWGERGSVDVLAWQPLRRALLIIEVKTKVADLQDLLSTMDRKRRLAPAMAKALGWKPLRIGSVLVLPGETWARNAVERFGPVFGAALPARTVEVTRWLAQPGGDIRGIWFLVNDTTRDPKRRSRGSMRVRPRRTEVPDATSRSGTAAG
jgi:transcriptional regulator with XRE-family HTH domain